MNERILRTVLVLVCTDPSLHSIMVERFAVVDVVGLGRGHSFGKNLGVLTAVKSQNFRKIFAPPPPPRPPTPTKNKNNKQIKKKPYQPGGRQRNLKTRRKLSGTTYVTGHYSAGAQYFSGMELFSMHR